MARSWRAVIGVSPAATPLSSPAKPLLGWPGKSPRPGGPSSANERGIELLRAVVARWRGYAQERSVFRKGLSAHIRQRLRTELRLALYVWHGVVVAQAAAADSHAACRDFEQIDPQYPNTPSPCAVEVLRPEPEPEPDVEPCSEPQQTQEFPRELTPQRTRISSNPARTHLSHLVTRLEQQHVEWQEATEAEQAKQAIRRLGARLQAAQMGAAKAGAACEAAAKRVRQAERSQLAAWQRCKTLEQAQADLQRELHDRQAAEQLARRQAADSRTALRQQHSQRLAAAIAWKHSHKLMRTAWQIWLFVADASLAIKAEAQRNEDKILADASSQLARDSWTEANSLRLMARHLRSSTRAIVVRWGRFTCCRCAARRVLVAHQKMRASVKLMKVMRGWLAVAAQSAELQRQTETRETLSAQRMTFVAHLAGIRDRQLLLRVLTGWSLASRLSSVRRDLSTAICANKAELLAREQQYSARKDVYCDKVMRISLSRSCRDALRRCIRRWQQYTVLMGTHQKLLCKARTSRLRAVVARWHQRVRVSKLHRRHRTLANAALCKHHLRMIQAVFYSWQRHIRRCYAAARAGHTMRVEELLNVQRKLACAFACSMRSKSMLRTVVIAWCDRISRAQTGRQLLRKLHQRLCRSVLAQWHTCVRHAKQHAALVSRHAVRHASRRLQVCLQCWSAVHRTKLRVSTMLCGASVRLRRQMLERWRQNHAAAIHDAVTAQAVQNALRQRTGALSRLDRRVQSRRLAWAFASLRIITQSMRQAAALRRRVQFRVAHRALIDWAAATARERYRDAVVSVHSALERQKDDFLQHLEDQTTHRLWHRHSLMVVGAWRRHSRRRARWSRCIARAVALRKVRSLAESLRSWIRATSTTKTAMQLQRRAHFHTKRRAIFAWHSAAVNANYTNTLLSHMEVARSVEEALGRESSRLVYVTDRLCHRFLRQVAMRRVGIVFSRWHQEAVAGSRLYTYAVTLSARRLSAAKHLYRSWVHWRSVAMSTKHTNLVSRCESERCGFKLVLQSQRNRLDKLQVTHAATVEDREAQADTLSNCQSQLVQLKQELKQHAGLECALAELQKRHKQAEAQWKEEAQAQQLKYDATLAAEKTAALLHIEGLHADRTTEARMKEEASTAMQRALEAEDRASAANDALIAAKEALLDAQQQFNDSKADRLAADALHGAQAAEAAAELARLEGLLESERQSCLHERVARESAERKYLQASEATTTAQLKADMVVAECSRNEAALLSKSEQAAVDAASLVSHLHRELALAQEEGAAAVRLWTQRHTEVTSECGIHADALQAKTMELSAVLEQLSHAETNLAEESRRCERANENAALKIKSTEVACNASIEVERAARAAAEEQLLALKEMEAANQQKLRSELMASIEAEKQEKQLLQLRVKELHNNSELQGREERLELKQQLQTARQHRCRSELVATGAVEAAERTHMLAIAILKQRDDRNPYLHQRGQEQELITQKSKDKTNSASNKHEKKIDLDNCTSKNLSTVAPNDAAKHMHQQPRLNQQKTDEAHVQAAADSATQTQQQEQKHRKQSHLEPSLIKSSCVIQHDSKSDTATLVLDGGRLSGLQAVRKKLRTAEIELGNIRALAGDVSSHTTRQTRTSTSGSGNLVAESAPIEIGEDTDLDISLDDVPNVFHTEPFHGEGESQDASEAMNDLESGDDDTDTQDDCDSSDEELLRVLSRTRPVPSMHSQKRVRKDGERFKIREGRNNGLCSGTRQQNTDEDASIAQTACIDGHPMPSHHQSAKTLDGGQGQQPRKSRRVAFVDQHSIDPPPMFFVPTIPPGGRSFRRTEFAELTLRAERDARQLASRSISASAVSSAVQKHLDYIPAGVSSSACKRLRLLKTAMLRWAVAGSNRLAGRNAYW